MIFLRQHDFYVLQRLLLHLPAVGNVCCSTFKMHFGSIVSLNLIIILFCIHLAQIQDLFLSKPFYAI